MNTKVSVIIPVFNEEKDVAKCLESLKKQNYKDFEIIVVDDGSSDKTLQIIKQHDVFILSQDHLGPGPARNLGASKSGGRILVFVDADMTFDKDFLKDLTKPILIGKTIGTFSKNELVANSDNPWSICWNINRNVPPERMLPADYPDSAPVYRAILKSEFTKVGGFSPTGEYTDDWSLSRKLGVESTVVEGATYYHKNPASLQEVFDQASWIGKSEFISGSFIRKIKSILIYNPLMSLVVSIFKSITNLNPNFLIFKLVYDSAIFKSVIQSFFSITKAK